jgi:hypothetical protein
MDELFGCFWLHSGLFVSLFMSENKTVVFPVVVKGMFSDGYSVQSLRCLRPMQIPRCLIPMKRPK